MLRALRTASRLAVAVGGVVVLLVAGGVAVIVASRPTPPQPSRAPEPMTAGKATELHSVACTTASFCLAVGSYSPDGSSENQRPLAEEWNGSEWSVLPTPRLFRDAVLEGVACTSSTTCVAVGSESSRGSQIQRALALDWDGASLSTTVMPSPPGDTVLNGISCPAVRRCVAVGSSKRGELPLALIESWNGQRWALGDAATPLASVDSWLNSVSCVLPTSCIAVGASSSSGDHDDPESNTLVESWNGSAWSVVPSPTPGSGNLGILTSVACTSPTTCIAVGNYSLTNNPYGDDTHALVEVGDHGSWTAEVATSLEGSSQSALQAIACPSSDKCAAVGSAPATAYGTADPLAATWTSGGWSRIPIQLPGSTLESVTCPTVTACLAVGERDGDTNAVAVWWRPTP